MRRTDRLRSIWNGCQRYCWGWGSDLSTALPLECHIRQPIVGGAAANVLPRSLLSTTAALNGAAPGLPSSRRQGGSLACLAIQRCLLSTAAVASVPYAPQSLPKFPKIPPSDKIQWRRMVLRFPPDVDTSIQGRDLVLSGKAGTVRINLHQMDPTGLMGYQFHPAPKAADGTATGQAIMLCCSPSKQYFRGFATHIDNQIRGVTQGYLVGLTIKGVGYRVEPADNIKPSTVPYYDHKFQDKQNVSYPVKKACTALRLKVGFSDTIVVPLPEDVQAFVVKPTLFYLYGVQKHRVMDAAARVRGLRKPNVYTGNGIRLVHEELNLKPKKGGAKAAK